MASGKRRANWEKVLEERMADARADIERQTLQVVELATRLNTDRIDQCHALEYRVGKIERDASRNTTAIGLVAAVVVMATLALAVLK